MRADVFARLLSLLHPRERPAALPTYGSDDRQSQPEVSQTLQIDRQHAAELVRILRETFPGLE